MWDLNGNEFIDLYCSMGPITLGYAYKPVDHAVKSGYERFIPVGYEPSAQC